MPKRNSKNTPEEESDDPNVIARRMVDMISGEGERPKRSSIKRSTISEVMAEMGRRGGKKGGKRRLVTMTPEERSQVALNAAKVRWAKRKNSEG